MAVKNIRVFIERPGYAGANKITPHSYLNGDTVRISRRLPYADITNLTTLKSEGFFRTDTKVAEVYGGKNGAEDKSTLGLILPRTEKLVLVAKLKVNATNLTISGNSRAGFEETRFTLNGTPGDIFTIDLFDFGKYINSDGDITIKLENQDLDMVLITRY